MRIAFITDIHGNLTALDAVLADLAHEQIDQYICLGDVVEFGPQPCECLRRVLALNALCIMGNTDERMAVPHRDHLRAHEQGPEIDMELWCYDQLTDADRAAIRQFNPSAEIKLDKDMRLLAYHGSPRSNVERVVSMTSYHDLDAMFANHNARILIGGHTHQQFIRHYNQAMLINPGSVGLPFERLGDGLDHRPPWAEYAVITAEQGRVSVDLRRTPIALTQLRDAVMHSGMPDPKWWLQDWELRLHSRE